MKLTMFFFGVIKFHVYHLTHGPSTAFAFGLNLYNYGEAFLAQILLGHFAYIQFECFRIPKITVFELTQIECLQFLLTNDLLLGDISTEDFALALPSKGGWQRCSKQL